MVTVFLLSSMSVGLLSGCGMQGDGHIYYNVAYLATSGGHLLHEGSNLQSVKEGDDGMIVTAIPYEGYYFSHWSDGATCTVRQEKNVRDSIVLTAFFVKYEYTVVYQSVEGGRLDGKGTQTIEYDEDAKPVTAVPNDGYLFVGWTDGIKSETRQDKNIKDDISVKALFKSKVQTFRYNYNYATANNLEQSITLSYDNVGTAVFAIPQKEHFTFDGWYLDAAFTNRVTDRNNVYYLGTSIFFSESDTLYAKWIPDQQVNYKILMVFVDEIHANLKTVDGTVVAVDYKMSLVERKILELIPMQLSKYLNEWFKGWITFEVDSYFTTVPVGDSAFTAGMGSDDKLSYRIFADDLPEVGSILNNYRSVNTSFATNDYDNKLNSSGGVATQKYASVNIGKWFNALKTNNEPLDILLDLNCVDWKFIMDIYTHEFVHTVETEMDYDDYHSTVSAYYSKMDVFDIAKLYLLNQIDLNGERVGIPYDYWVGNVDIRIYYEADIGGRVNGNYTVYRKIPYGSDVEEITATADSGYRFIGWSDGVKSATRKDTNIISYLHVRAMFVKIE